MHNSNFLNSFVLLVDHAWIQNINWDQKTQEIIHNWYPSKKNNFTTSKNFGIGFISFFSLFHQFRAPISEFRSPKAFWQSIFSPLPLRRIIPKSWNSEFSYRITFYCTWKIIPNQFGQNPNQLVSKSASTHTKTARWFNIQKKILIFSQKLNLPKKKIKIKIPTLIAEKNFHEVNQEKKIQNCYLKYKQFFP